MNIFMMDSRDYESKLEKMYGNYQRMTEGLRPQGLEGGAYDVCQSQRHTNDLSQQARDLINQHSIEGILAGKVRSDAMLQRLEGKFFLFSF